MQDINKIAGNDNHSGFVKDKVSAFYLRWHELGQRIPSSDSLRLLEELSEMKELILTLISQLEEIPILERNSGVISLLEDCESMLESHRLRLLKY